MEGNQRPVLWFHCSSLGEFEQGRPVIEAVRENHPDYFILISFFSPSGYEVRRNYPMADYVCYLPADTSRNARAWMHIIKPAAAVFVKYEFWFEFLKQLRRENIPVLLVSANFRKDQLFFKWYGGWYRKMLDFFTVLFVQHASSVELLKTIQITHARVAGDTRFDRVAAIPTQVKDVPVVSAFCSNQPVIIAGSTWSPDEDLLTRFINEYHGKVKFILVPHEIAESSLRQLEMKLNEKVIRYSKLSANDAVTYRTLIIDNVGMLSNLYRYGHIAYIGGGFGKGIHNTLEAATFGMPVVFGPSYQRFREAVALVERKCAFPVYGYEDLRKVLSGMLADEDDRKRCGALAASYVQENKGATAIITGTLNELIGK